MVCVNPIIFVSVKKRGVDLLFCLREVILIKINQKNIKYPMCMLGISGLRNLAEFGKFEFIDLVKKQKDTI